MNKRQTRHSSIDPKKLDTNSLGRVIKENKPKLENFPSPPVLDKDI